MQILIVYAVVLLHTNILKKTLFNMVFDFVKSTGSLRKIISFVKVLGTINTYDLFHTDCEGDRDTVCSTGSPSNPDL